MKKLVLSVFLCLLVLCLTLPCFASFPAYDHYRVDNAEYLEIIKNNPRSRLIQRCKVLELFKLHCRLRSLLFRIIGGILSNNLFTFARQLDHQFRISRLIGRLCQQRLNILITG